MLPLHRLTDSLVRQVRDLVSEHPGSCAVHLRVGEKVLRLPPQFNVDPRGGLVGALKELLGTSAVAALSGAFGDSPGRSAVRSRRLVAVRARDVCGLSGTLGIGVATGGRLLFDAVTSRVAGRPGRREESDAREHGTVMAIEIEVATKDCTALTDAELAEMADLSAAETKRLGGGLPVEAARGVGARYPGPRAGKASWLRAGNPRADRWHAKPADRRRRLLPRPQRQLPLFVQRCTISTAAPSWRSPTRTSSSARGSPSLPGFRAFAGLEDVVPRLDHRATGEERAWGRRLAKRFGAEGQLDDRTFVLKGDGDAAGLLDYDPQKPLREVEALADLFGPVRRRASRQPRGVRLGDGRGPGGKQLPL